MEHSFNTGIAKVVGIEGAILLKHLFYWVQKNYGNGKHYYDGSYWTYNSVRGFGIIFDYLNQKQISRILNNLIKGGYIKTGNYNANKMDRTMWYAFTENGMRLMNENGFALDGNADSAKEGNALYQNEEMHLPKMGNGNTEKGKCNTNIVTDKNKKDINLPTNVGMSQSDPVDYERLKDYFNEELVKHNSVIPKLASVTDRRRQSIKARVREHGKTALMGVIVKAAASAFLNGRNGRAFVASFDWLIKPNNFVKVLEGNYDDNINNITDGNNRSNNGREQRIAEVAAIMDRLMAQDDAERAQ